MGGRRRTGGCAGVGALVLALGCGGDEAPRPSGAEVPGGNAVPVIEQVRLEPRHPLPGTTLRAAVRVRDPDGDAVDLRHDWSVDGRPVPESGPELDLAGVAKGAQIEVAVVASDVFGESDPQRDAVTVANARPALEAVRIEPRGDVEAGTLLRISAEGADPDGDRLEYRYEWRIDGRVTEHRGPTLSTASHPPGTEIQARVVASDGDEESDPIDTARVRIANAAPVVTSEPGGFAADGVFRYRVEARDPEGTPLRFRLRTAPVGMQIDALRGEVVWRPGRSQLGLHPVEIEVADAAGARTIHSFDITVRGGGAPAAPAPAPE